MQNPLITEDARLFQISPCDAEPLHQNFKNNLLPLLNTYEELPDGQTQNIFINVGTLQRFLSQVNQMARINGKSNPILRIDFAQYPRVIDENLGITPELLSRLTLTFTPVFYDESKAELGLAAACEPQTNILALNFSKIVPPPL